MAQERPPAIPCRWRNSSETLDVIDALERIEALLARLDERIGRLEQDKSVEERRRER